MSLVTLGLAFVAGLLSVLAPCVLPLIPIVLASATEAHRWGPFALAAGLAISFTLIGLFVATTGLALGFDADWFRAAGAILMLLLGAVLLLPALYEAIAGASGPVSNWLSVTLGGFSTSGMSGQFLLGALLGAVWAPCVGPTLGAASLLAAKGDRLADVALTMAMFGVGAALPLVIMGFLTREALQASRGRLMSAGVQGKAILGAILVTLGLLTLSGYDKVIETALVEASPSWLTGLTTRF